MLHVSAADLVIGAAAGKGDKHHYIPVFYSKGWTGQDGRLCEYSRPYKIVKAKHVHPGGTGYVRGLYTVPRNDPSVAEYIERQFFRITDNSAAVVLAELRSGTEIVWNVDNRSDWSRFILSLMMRNPEYIARMGAEVVGFFDPSSTLLNESYRKVRRPEDLETYAEYIAKTEHPAGRTSAIAMQRIIDSPNMGGHLNRMNWNVVTFSQAKHSLLTSDRPIIMTNGLGHGDSHLAIPIGPFKLFVATNNEETTVRLRNMPPALLMRQTNERVALQARRFVYGIDDTQSRFVENRLAKQLPSTPLEIARPLYGAPP